MNTQDRNTVLVVILLIGGLCCCCLLGFALYGAVLFSADPGLLNPALRPTPTLISREELNEVSPLGKFYFGRDDVDDNCHVTNQIDTFSQEDLLRNKYIFFSAPFPSKFEGNRIDWFVYDERGRSIDAGGRQSFRLEHDLENCLQAIVFLDPRIEPGDYILEVEYEGQLAFRKVFTITYSDLDKIPRPERSLFGDFTFGRGLDTSSCSVEHHTSTYPLADLKNDPWFYFASGYRMSEIGKKVYWYVRDSNGNFVFRRNERVVRDDIDLCFWQGFSMKDSAASKYTLVVEDDQGKILYQSDFELK